MPVISELPLSSQFNLHHPASGSDFSLVRWPNVKQCQLRQHEGHNMRKRVLLFLLRSSSCAARLACRAASGRDISGQAFL